MIIVFFVPGMFGSTIEAMLSSFTSEYSKSNFSLKITKDGSMHTFGKQYHPLTKNAILSIIDNPAEICTPIYPVVDAKLPDLANDLQVTDKDQIVLIHATDFKAAELNMLFQYHKISNGVLNKSLDIFCNNNYDNIIKWNKNYSSWQDMQIWELREWFSLFYPNWIQEWIDSKNVNFKTSSLKVRNSDLLNGLENTFNEICQYLGLTVIDKTRLTNFCNEWASAQKYIVDEYKLLDLIVENTINNKDFNWQDLNIIAEAIIQQNLRLAGYEIRCYNLNKFPTNSLELNKLLEKC